MEMSVAKLRAIEEARFQMKKLKEEKQAAMRHLKVRIDSRPANIILY
jgi:hypothetical protein